MECADEQWGGWGAGRAPCSKIVRVGVGGGGAEGGRLLVVNHGGMWLLVEGGQDGWSARTSSGAGGARGVL